jgi:DNA polymerase III sliding clamp (beta) subunit (PCNA family)
MRFNTNVSPCVVCPVTGNQYTYLILPVRVAE